MSNRTRRRRWHIEYHICFVRLRDRLRAERGHSMFRTSGAGTVSYGFYVAELGPKFSFDEGFTFSSPTRLGLRQLKDDRNDDHN